MNNKRKKIETTILNSIDFNQIENDNEDVIIYYKPNLNEGLIGIIASRLKDHFNKPSIVITRSNNLLKGSARSVFNYNIGRTIKNLLDKNIILNGGGHMMAAGFTLEMKNISKLKNYVINDFLKNNKIKFPILGKPIRFLLINSYQGPSISDIFVILGKKDTIDRLNQYRDN